MRESYELLLKIEKNFIEQVLTLEISKNYSVETDVLKDIILSETVSTLRYLESNNDQELAYKFTYPDAKESATLYEFYSDLHPEYPEVNVFSVDVTAKYF